MRRTRIGQEERRLLSELRDALGSSLDIHEVVRAAYPLLLKAVPADYAALGVTRPGRPEEFEWIVANMPAPFFAAYADMKPHDFVLRSVLKAPNVALRDAEMVPRRELEQNMMYGRARDLGMPLEQVMSVMLHVDDAWQSGVSLYRAERRPFSRREQAILQEVTPALANAVRNCRMFGDAARRGRILGDLLSREGLAAVVLAGSGREIARTGAATAMLEKWFRGDAGLGRVPGTLVDAVLRAESLGDAPSEALARRGEDADLVVRIYRMTDDGESYRTVVLEEVPHGPTLPASWRARLTRAETEVVARVIRGWDNRLIADELRIADATVKKHIQHVFDKLGVSRRAELIARVARERR